jgi:hypothetical protein
VNEIVRVRIGDLPTVGDVAIKTSALFLVFTWPSSKPKGPSPSWLLTWHKASSSKAPMNLTAKGAHPCRRHESAVKPNRLRMHMVNLDLGRLPRVLADVAVLAGLAASIVSCSGDGSNASSATQSPTTTTTPQSPTPRADPSRADRKECQPHLRQAVHADCAGTSGTDGNPRTQRKH